MQILKASTDAPIHNSSSIGISKCASSLVLLVKMFILSFLPVILLFQEVIYKVRSQDFDDVEVDGDEQYYDKTDERGSDADPNAPYEEESDKNVQYSFSEEKPPGLDGYVLFSEYPDNVIPAGEPLRILVGFQNSHESMKYRIHYIFASFHYPKMMSHYMQNFSAYRYDHSVESGHSKSLKYTFWPSESYVDITVGILVRALVRDQNATEFVCIAYNQTIKFTESTKISFDFQITFLVTSFLAIISSVVYWFYSGIIKKKIQTLRKSRKNVVVETGTSQKHKNIDISWIQKETASLHVLVPRKSGKSRKI